MREVVCELIEGAQTTWPAKGQLLVVALSVKYALLNRLGITN